MGDDTDIAKKQAEFLQNALEKLPGMKITLSNVPFKTRLSRSNDGDFDMVMTGWNADFPDPINFLTLQVSKAAYNRGKWSNSTFDNFVNKSLTDDANSPKKRWQDMKDAQDVLNEEQGIVPLYQQGDAHMTKSSIKNYAVTPNGSYNTVLLRLQK